MAASMAKSLISLLLCFCFLVSIDGKNLKQSSTQRKLRMKMREKVSHFHFYWHDVLNGRNATAVRVAQAPSTKASQTSFGALMVIDDALTEGPEPSSKLLGRAQGFYVAASQEEMGLLMAMNFAFEQGKYNGSTITVLGRNPVYNKVREMPVIGGSGLFRLARGYARVKTRLFDRKSGNAIVEYNVVVIHY